MNLSMLCWEGRSILPMHGAAYMSCLAVQPLLLLRCQWVPCVFLPMKVSGVCRNTLVQQLAVDVCTAVRKVNGKNVF